MVHLLRYLIALAYIYFHSFNYQWLLNLKNNLLFFWSLCSLCICSVILLLFSLRITNNISKMHYFFSSLLLFLLLLFCEHCCINIELYKINLSNVYYENWDVLKD